MLLALVVLNLLAGANTVTFAQTYRVAGTAVNDADGAPLGRTRVSLAEVQDRRKAESIITEADGRFEFRNVPAGKFSLEGARRNFMRTAYQWHEGFSTAIVTGAGVDTENLVLRLIPLGSISGKVIDETGEPVRNANVKLAVHRGRLGEDRVLPQGYATTDDEGKYEFRDLIPGEYFVSVSAKPWYAVYPVFANENGVRTRVDTIGPELNVAYARTYYNGATDSAEATPLSVKKGERLTADIHLNPVPALTVVVKMQEDSVRHSVSWAGL
jgi:Carboxypeptidase regulatory-like domain